MIFGFVLLNDWSARDNPAMGISALGRSSQALRDLDQPWIVTCEALEPFACTERRAGSDAAAYLRQARPNNYDLALDVGCARAMSGGSAICRTNFKYMYWSSVQQLMHHASSGCA